MNNGPVFLYSAAFEATRIRELAERFPDWIQPLEEILDRLVDLLLVARNRDYHPPGVALRLRGHYAVAGPLPPPKEWIRGAGWLLVYALRGIGRGRRVAALDSLALVFVPDGGEKVRPADFARFCCRPWRTISWHRRAFYTDDC